MCPRDFLAEDFPAPAQQVSERQGRDYLAEEPKETFGEALGNAPGRVVRDVGKGLLNFAGGIPGFLKNLSSDVPLDLSLQDIKHSEMNKLAGFAKSGQTIFNTPHDLVNYMSERLHLIPEDINKKVQMGRMPDSTEDINAVFGAPRNPHEQAVRDIAGHWPEIASMRPLGALNPAKYTTKETVGNILKTGAEQEAKHSGMYENIFQQGRNAGLNNVPFQRLPFMMDLRTIAKYQTPLKYKSSVDFYRRPTLQNAQRAKSDLDQIARTIQETERTRPLTGEERNLYHSVIRNRDQIVKSMFKDKRGNLNEKLNQGYRDINKSYAENVVPYKYNPDIQAFKNREITAKKLLERLRSGGEFEVKKGKEHPELYRNEALRKAMIGIGIGTSGALGTGLYKYLTAKPTE